MRILYLVNVYPAVSHSFVRREILALEAAGLEVRRVSIRPFSPKQVDAADAAEAERTQVILGKDSPIIKDKKVAICQSLSGTGALRISAEFLAQYNPGVDVYCSDPTWGNHHAIFAKAGLKTHKYRYLNKVLTSSSLRP